MMIPSKTLTFMSISIALVVLAGCQHQNQYKPDQKEQSMLRVARSMQDQGNHKTSYNFYVQVLEKNPNSTDAHIGLMDLAMAAKEPREAFKQHQIATRHIKNSEELDHYLFRIYMAMNDIYGAHNHALYLTKTYPKSASSWRQLGTVLDAKHEHLAAQNAYQTALNIDPNDVKTKSNMGLSYALSNQSKEAVNILRSAFLSPDSTLQDKHNYVIALVMDNKLDEAELLLAEDLSPSERLETISFLQNYRTQMVE